MVGAGEGGLSVEDVAQSIIPAAVDYLGSLPLPTLRKVFFIAYNERARMRLRGRAAGLRCSRQTRQNGLRMTSAWPLLVEKRAEIAPALRREFWLPLRRLIKMFHILPVAAAAALFGLLALDGQLTEIYVSYMEDIASAGLAIDNHSLRRGRRRFRLDQRGSLRRPLSAQRAAYQRHLFDELRGRDRLQAAAGPGRLGDRHCAVALVRTGGRPMHAKVSLTGLFEKLQQAKINPAALLQHVPEPSVWAVSCAILILGLVMSSLVAVHPKNRTLQRTVMMATPLAAVLVFRPLDQCTAAGRNGVQAWRKSRRHRHRGWLLRRLSSH